MPIGTWFLSALYEDYIIELDPFLRPTDEEIRESKRIAASLLYAFQYRDEQITRVFIEIYKTITQRVMISLFSAEDLDQFSQNRGWMQDMSDQLESYVRSGMIRIRPQNRRSQTISESFSHVPPLEPPPMPPPAPHVEEPQKTFFEVQIIDQFGRVLDGIPVLFSVGGTRHSIESNEEGIAYLGDQDMNFATVEIEDIEAVRTKLKQLGLPS